MSVAMCTTLVPDKSCRSLQTDLFVETYRLSSHARLEAFVIQTKLN